MQAQGYRIAESHRLVGVPPERVSEEWKSGGAGYWLDIQGDCHEVLDLFDPVIDGTTKVEAEIEGNLIVSRSSRVQVARLRTDQLTQPAFDSGVNVFVGGPELEPTGVRLLEDVFEALLDPLDDVYRKQIDLAEHGHVGERPSDVVNQESSVRRIGREPPQRLPRSRSEPATPQCHIADPIVPGTRDWGHETRDARHETGLPPCVPPSFGRGDRKPSCCSRLIPPLPFSFRRRFSVSDSGDG